MRRQAILLLTAMAAASLLLIARSSPAEARTVDAASCPLNSGASQIVLQNKMYAESFTPTHSGKITRGFIETFNTMEKPAPYVVEIWNADASGVPTGSAALSSTVVNHPHYGYDFGYPIFSAPAKVIAGQNYALVVTVVEPSINGVVTDRDDPCSGTFSLDQTGSGTFAADASNRDMVFLLTETLRRHHRHHRR